MKTHQNQYLKHPDHLFSYWSYQPGIFVVIAITGILYNFGMLASPYFEGRLIDGIEGNETTSQIWALLGIFILTIVIVQIARILKRYFVRRFANNATYTMRLNIYNNILNLSSQELANADIGNLLARDISDVKNAVEGMRKLTTEIFDTVFLFAFYAIYLVLFDYQMTLYAFIPVIAAIVVAFSMRTMIYKAKSASRKLNSEMTSKTYDLFENAMTYRTFGRDDDNLKDYDKTLNEYEKKNFKATVLTDTMIPIAYVIALLGLIPVVYLGVQHVSNSDPLFAPIPNIMNSTWTIGQFSTYLSTFVLMSTKASHTAKLFGSIESGLASWKRIKPQIKPYKEYSNPVEINNDNKLIASNLCVRIDNKCLFHALSFEAKKGEVIGITGPIAKIGSN
jgi:ABC-type multidrug transport system fused ATPase/permease subunit